MKLLSISGLILATSLLSMNHAFAHQGGRQHHERHQQERYLGTDRHARHHRDHGHGHHHRHHRYRSWHHARRAHHREYRSGYWIYIPW